MSSNNNGTLVHTDTDNFIYYRSRDYNDSKNFRETVTQTPVIFFAHLRPENENKSTYRKLGN